MGRPIGDGWALVVSLPTAVSGSLFFPLRSPGVYAWGGGPKQPFSFPAFPLQGTLCVQSPEERPLKGPKEKGKEFFCCPCDPAVNGWATERRKRACPASIWQPYDQSSMVVRRISPSPHLPLYFLLAHGYRLGKLVQINGILWI
jgi:hypothetical protein